MTRAPNEPAKLTSGTVEMPANDTSRSNVIATIAPSDAPADTPSVSGEASGLRSSAWNTTPDSPSALPTSAAAHTRGEPAGQGGEEEDLRVRFAGVRNRSIEDRTQVDPRAAHERREQQRQRGERTKRGDRQGKTPADRRRVNAIGQSAPPSHGRPAGGTARPPRPRTTAGPPPRSESR